MMLKYIRLIPINPNCKYKKQFAEFLCECGNVCYKPEHTRSETCGKCKKPKVIYRISKADRYRREREYTKRIKKLEGNIIASRNKCIARGDVNYQKQIELDNGDEIKALKSEREFLDLPEVI